MIILHSCLQISFVTQIEPESAQAIPWFQVSSNHPTIDDKVLLKNNGLMFNRPLAVIKARLKNAVVGVGRSRAVSGILTQTKGVLSVAKKLLMRCYSTKYY